MRGVAATISPGCVRGRCGATISRASRGSSRWTCTTFATWWHCGPQAYAGHLGLLLDFVPDVGSREVPDPYFGGPEGFEHVLDLMERASAALLARIRASERAT